MRPTFQQNPVWNNTQQEPLIGAHPAKSGKAGETASASGEIPVSYPAQYQNTGYNGTPPSQQHIPQPFFSQQSLNPSTQTTQQAFQSPPPFQPSLIPVNGSENPYAQIGLMMGSQAFTAGQEYVSKNDWQRQVKRSEVTGQIEGFKPPSQDINSPDLYIPTMAVLSYVLIVGFINGIRKTFQPDILGYTASKAFIFIFIECLVVKLGGYLLNISAGISLFEILAIIGYNYVLLIYSILVGFFGGSMAKYLVFSYTSVAMAFFLLRTLRGAILPEINPGAFVPEHRRRRINFLFTIVAAQIIASFFLLI